MTQDFAKIRPEPLLEKKPASNPPATAELANRASTDSEPGTPAESDPAETPLEYEFYRELQEYEVLVDATPVDLSAQDPNRRLERDYLLQTGAFERRELAETEQQRQAALGLNVFVKDPGIVGRSLFLVQSGELDNAETVLRRNSIPFLRLTSQSD